MEASYQTKRAQLLIEQQRYNEALKELRVLLASDPNNAHTLYLMSVCYLELNNIVESEALIHAAIGIRPDDDALFFQLARIQLYKEELPEAEKTIRSAIQFQPYEASYWGILALIKLNQKKYQEALEAANKGLELESDNVFCLNQRSTALIKLNRKEEAFQTLEGMLQEDPENSYTHSNYGWAELEKGNHKKALEHFREALKLNPVNDHAKSGMVEALKSRYLLYRIFLKYAFWAANLSSQAQWGLIIGLFILRQITERIAKGDSALAKMAMVFNVIYFAFILTTWLITPVSNLLLRLNQYGRYALNDEAKRSSSYVGFSLLAGVVGFLFYLAFQHNYFLVLGFVGVGCSLPLSSMYNPSKEKNKKTMKVYALSMIGVGALAVLLTFITGDDFNVFTLLFAIGFFVHGWVLNAMVIR